MRTNRESKNPNAPLGMLRIPNLRGGGPLLTPVRFLLTGGSYDRSLDSAQCGRTFLKTDLLGTNHCRWGDPVPAEIAVPILWQLAVIMFLVLLGKILRGRPNFQSSRTLHRKGQRKHSVDLPLRKKYLQKLDL